MLEIWHVLFNRLMISRARVGRKAAGIGTHKRNTASRALNDVQSFIFVKAAYRHGHRVGTYPLHVFLSVFNQPLRMSSSLPLCRKNVLCNLLLIGFGQLQKAASVFKTGAALFNDAHDLTKHSRFRPVLQQLDLQ